MTRLGVAGLGWLGESLIKDVPRVAGLQLVAVQDVAPHRASTVASACGVPNWTERFDDLIGSSEIDALLICTPNHLHAQQAQQALQAGKDVLVQKPLALSCADAKNTVDAALRSHRLLFVDYTYRFLPTMAVFREALESTPHVGRARAAFHNIYGPGPEKRWFFDRSQSGGGALTDLGVHLLDLALWLFSPAEASLEHVELGDADPVELAAELTVRLDDVKLDLSVSWHAPMPASEICFEVETADGLLRWQNVDGSFFHFRAMRDETVLLDRETTLREDTLRAFAHALVTRDAPPVDVRVYALLDRAYARPG